MTESLVSRRGFLAAAGALPVGMSAYAAGSDVIRVGVIGCGGRGEAAAMNAMNAGKDVRIVAMGDLLRDRVEEKRTAIAEVPGPGTGRRRSHLLGIWRVQRRARQRRGCRHHRQCR